MTQCDRVLKYINDFGTINQIQALADLGIMRLGARVWDLRHKHNYPIKSRTVHGKNRYGEPVCYSEYFMEGNNNA